MLVGPDCPHTRHGGSRIKRAPHRGQQYCFGIELWPCEMIATKMGNGFEGEMRSERLQIMLITLFDPQSTTSSFRRVRWIA